MQAAQRSPCSPRRSCGYAHAVTRRCAQRCRPANMSRAVCAPRGHFATLVYIGRSCILQMHAAFPMFFHSYAVCDALLHTYRRPLVQPHSLIFSTNAIIPSILYQIFEKNDIFRIDTVEHTLCEPLLLAKARDPITKYEN